MCSSVLLPEPDGPMIATNSPRGDVEVDAVERAHVGGAGAVDLLERTDLDAGGGDRDMGGSIAAPAFDVVAVVIRGKPRSAAVGDR